MPRHITRGRIAPWASVAVLLLLGGGAAAASVLTAPTSSPPTSAEVPSSSTTSGPPVSSASPPTSPGSIPTFTPPSTVPYAPPPPGALTTRIELPSTSLVAGSTVRGNLVVTNHTDRTFNLTEGCRPYWAVGLRSSTIAFNPAIPTVCALVPFWVYPGTNRLPFKLLVSYPACSSGPQGATPTLPACPGGTALPPLPPGNYEAVLVSGTAALRAAPVDVEVVAG